MESSILLVFAGLIIGTFGTLIGAGGGFILVPLLLLFYPGLPPETVTAISMAVVAVNAISGTLAYGRSGRIDYKAGIVFALFTIPGSILGVYSVKYIPLESFNIIFGLLMVVLAAYLFLKKSKNDVDAGADGNKKGLISRILFDKSGNQYAYSYNQTYGIIISILVGYLSPLLGIGGGIIHVPAMVNWLHFPVYIATATSHFILSVMATVSVIVHFMDGHYHDPEIVKMILLLALGVVPGAQLGAYLSHRIKGKTIVKVLAICLLLVGIRILIKNF